MKKIAILIVFLFAQNAIMAQNYDETVVHMTGENIAVITEEDASPERVEEVLGAHGIYVERIFPNPAQNLTYINVEWGMDEDITVALELYDLTGKRIYAERKTLTNGDNTIKIDTSPMPEGIYMLAIKGENGYHEVIDNMSKLVIAR